MRFCAEIEEVKWGWGVWRDHKYRKARIPLEGESGRWVPTWSDSLLSSSLSQQSCLCYGHWFLPVAPWYDDKGFLWLGSYARTFPSRDFGISHPPFWVCFLRGHLILKHRIPFLSRPQSRETVRGSFYPESLSALGKSPRAVPGCSGSTAWLTLFPSQGCRRCLEWEKRKHLWAVAIIG